MNRLLKGRLGIVVRWMVILTGTYLLICLLLMVVQRRMQYFPWPGPVRIPPQEDYNGIEDVTLATEDGLRLRAWHWPGSRPLTIVIFHGNAGNRGHRLDWMEKLHGRGFGVFVLDYRGYGGSEGSPTEEGLYLDGEATIRWLRERDDVGELVYLGESLGAGVAVEMAVRHPPAALIVQSGFSSAVDVARKHYPFLPVSLLMKDRYENSRKIVDVRCPKLFIHGELDNIVPIELGRRLYEKAPEPKEFYSLPADHNYLVDIGGPRYLDRLEEFLVSGDDG